LHDDDDDDDDDQDIYNNNEHHRRLRGDRIPVPAIISGFAKGERDLVSEHSHSRLAC